MCHCTWHYIADASLGAVPMMHVKVNDSNFLDLMTVNVHCIRCSDCDIAEDAKAKTISSIKASLYTTSWTRMMTLEARTKLDFQKLKRNQRCI